MLYGFNYFLGRVTFLVSIYMKFIQTCFYKKVIVILVNTNLFYIFRKYRSYIDIFSEKKNKLCIK